jgi:hypothetical protein
MRPGSLSVQPSFETRAKSALLRMREMRMVLILRSGVFAASLRMAAKKVDGSKISGVTPIRCR